MKICDNRNTLGGLINARLADIGASNIPTAAKSIIEADVERACTRAVERAVTGPTVGRAVARALAAPAARGCKGDVSPLPSREAVREARIIVAGRESDSNIIKAADTFNGADNPAKGDGV